MSTNLLFFWKNRSCRALLLANLVPLVGVLFFHWDVFSLLLSYWMENVVIGFYNILKMPRAEGKVFVNGHKIVFPDKPGATPMSPDELKKIKSVMIPFFFFHYGIFMLGHAVFIVDILPALAGSPADISALVSTAFLPMIATVLGLLVSHGISYYDNFVGREEYKQINVVAQAFAPYKRLFVMHISVIAGSILLVFTHYTPAVLVVLIFLKVLIDYKFHKIFHPQLQKVFSEVKV